MRLIVGSPKPQSLTSFSVYIQLSGPPQLIHTQAMNSFNEKSKKRSRDEVSAPVNPAPVDDDDDGEFKLRYSLAGEPSLTRL